MKEIFQIELSFKNNEIPHEMMYDIFKDTRKQLGYPAIDNDDFNQEKYKWRHTSWYYDTNHDKDIIYMTFLFKKKNDAMIFKLTWGGK